MKMVNRVKQWLADGQDVRIFTARAGDAYAQAAIKKWCKQWLGQALPITNVKDHGLTTLYDDRAVQVERNTGKLIGE
jgi:hypothetical protein